MPCVPTHYPLYYITLWLWMKGLTRLNLDWPNPGKRSMRICSVWTPESRILMAEQWFSGVEEQENGEAAAA